MLPNMQPLFPNGYSRITSQLPQSTAPHFPPKHCVSPGHVTRKVRVNTFTHTEAGFVMWYSPVSLLQTEQLADFLFQFTAKLDLGIILQQIINALG